MFQILFFYYKNYRWLRILCAVSLLLCGMFFILLFGGFPPPAWRFLAHVIATLPVLLATRGLLVVLPFLGLVLQSFLIVALWVAWVFAIIRVLWYELFQAKQHLVQEEQEEPERHETEQQVQQTPLPVQSSPFDAFPDTVYPRMPSSARRYSAPSVPAQRATSQSSSPIPARASAQLVAVHESVQRMPAATKNASLEAGRPQGSPLHVRETLIGANVSLQKGQGHPQGDAPPIHEDTSHHIWSYGRGIPLRVPLPQLSTHDAIHYDEDTIEEFTEYEPFLDEFDEDEVRSEEGLQEYPQLRLIVGIGSHPGIVRKNGVNEDNVLGVQDTYVTETGVVPVGLFVVADGMGGHSHGQEASRLAVCSVSEVVTPMVLNAKAEDTLCEELLEDGVQRANTAIYQHNQQKFTMGTTITTAIVFGSTAYVANVGDSRTYLYRATDGLTQITSDHSHVWQLFKEGCIEHEDIYTHPKRNEIYRCLGESARVEIDTFQVTLQADDVLLLCTDGLWEMVRDAEIEHIIQHNALHASQMSAKLIEAALRNGGADNVSAVVVCIDTKE